MYIIRKLVQRNGEDLYIVRTPFPDNSGNLYFAGNIVYYPLCGCRDEAIKNFTYQSKPDAEKLADLLGRRGKDKFVIEEVTVAAQTSPQ